MKSGVKGDVVKWLPPGPQGQDAPSFVCKTFISQLLVTDYCCENCKSSGVINSKSKSRSSQGQVKAKPKAKLKARDQRSPSGSEP